MTTTSAAVTLWTWTPVSGPASRARGDVQGPTHPNERLPRLSRDFPIRCCCLNSENKTVAEVNADVSRGIRPSRGLKIEDLESVRTWKSRDLEIKGPGYVLIIDRHARRRRRQSLSRSRKSRAGCPQLEPCRCVEPGGDTWPHFPGRPFCRTRVSICGLAGRRSIQHPCGRDTPWMSPWATALVQRLGVSLFPPANPGTDDARDGSPSPDRKRHFSDQPGLPVLLAAVQMGSLGVVHRDLSSLRAYPA